MKRLAALASLQRPYNNQIMTPRQLYEWAVDNVPSVQFEYSSMEDYREEAEHLEQRFLLSRTIPGTRKYHCFIPVSSNEVKVAYYFHREKVTLGSNDLPIESITGFVTCLSEHKWWLACVVKTISIESCVQLTFLHPHGPSSSNHLRQGFGTCRSKDQVWSH